MGTLTGKSIIERVEYVLSDADNVRWTEAELLDWLNSAQRSIVVLKPNASVSAVNVPLVEGTKQNIGTTYHHLFGVVRNMGAGGATPGPGVRQIERVHLDVAFADWHMAEYADSTVQHFFFDEKDPKAFYVFPPQPASTSQQLECKVGTTPTALTNVTGTLALDDIYENALVDYVLYRAFSKDDDSPANRVRSQAHYSAFLQELGARSNLDSSYSADKDHLEPSGGAK